MKLLRISFIALLALAACGGGRCGKTIDSSDVNFSEIEARYEADREESDPEKVNINLTFDASSLNLFDTIKFNEGEHFYVNGDEIKYDDTSYQKTMELGTSTPSVDIVFQDKMGVQYTQTIELAPIVTITQLAPGSEVDFSQSFTITYTPATEMYGYYSWGDAEDDNTSNNGSSAASGTDGSALVSPLNPLPPPGTKVKFIYTKDVTTSGIPAGFQNGFVTSTYALTPFELIAQ